MLRWPLASQLNEKYIYIYIYINDSVEYPRDKDVNGLGTTCRQ